MRFFSAGTVVKIMARMDMRDTLSQKSPFLADRGLQEGVTRPNDRGPLPSYPSKRFSSSEALFIAWDPWDFLLKPFV